MSSPKPNFPALQDFVSAAQNAMKAEFDGDDVTATYTALLGGVADLELAYLSILYKEPADDIVYGH